MTDAERKLWSRLRRKQLAGLRFRRQSPVGPFVADFLSAEARLIIEVDGGQHADRSAHDEKRSRFLEGQGYRVLRFWNNQVLAETESVLEAILAVATASTPSQPSPSEEGEGNSEFIPSPSSEGEGRDGGV